VPLSHAGWTTLRVLAPDRRGRTFDLDGRQWPGAAPRWIRQDAPRVTSWFLLRLRYFQDVHTDGVFNRVQIDVHSRRSGHLTNDVGAVGATAVPGDSGKEYG